MSLPISLNLHSRLHYSLKRPNSFWIRFFDIRRANRIGGCEVETSCLFQFPSPLSSLGIRLRLCMCSHSSSLMLYVSLALELLLESKFLRPPTPLNHSSLNPSSYYPSCDISISRGFLTGSSSRVHSLWIRVSDQLSFYTTAQKSRDVLYILVCLLVGFVGPLFGFLRVTLPISKIDFPTSAEQVERALDYRVLCLCVESVEMRDWTGEPSFRFG